MKVLFDLNHPAHFHLFKNFINYLNVKNIETIVTIKDKDVLKQLLDHDAIRYIPLIKSASNFLKQLTNLIIKLKELYKISNEFKISYSFGTSTSISHLSILTKIKSFNFNEDDDKIVPIYTWLTYPFTNYIINPDCITYSRWKNKRVLYNSYHELAYLHPNNFKPDEGILKKYNLENKNYVILRLNSLTAHHDVGAKGISTELYSKIKEELKDYTIIESRENSKTHQIEPWDMHHILAYAKMIISDSQTMTIEAAVLGVPAVRINTFIGKSTVIDELEQNKYKLAYGFYPHQEKEAMDTIKYLANNSEVDNLWQERRQVMLADKCDLNQWMIDYFEKEINK